MSRAEEVSQHPLFEDEPKISISLAYDNKTRELVGGTVDMNHADKYHWTNLATLIRPIIFLENDPISLVGFINQISKEHVDLRPPLKNGKLKYVKWQQTPLMYTVSETEKPARQKSREGGHSVDFLSVGEAGRVPPGWDFSKSVSDIEYAKIYLNGKLFHADSDKSKIFDKASALLKSTMIKCAELRTIHSLPFIEGARLFILDSREKGYDF
jgi:hypothetical protein